MYRYNEMKKIALALMLGCACGSCSDGKAPAANQGSVAEQAITPGGIQSPYRDAGEIEEATQKGLAGDGDAAWGLSTHYMARKDFVRAKYWQEIAIQSHNASAINVTAGSLMSRSDPCAKIRGVAIAEYGLRGLPDAEKQEYLETVGVHVEEARKEIASAPNKVCMDSTPQ